MTKTLYFPIRLALSFDKHNINIVRIIDEISTEFISIPHYHFESFLKRCMEQDPLFVVEEINKPEDESYRSDRAHLVATLVDEFLTEQQANIERVRILRVPSAYLTQFHKKGIEPAYHKPLWLCRFYKAKDFS